MSHAAPVVKAGGMGLFACALLVLLLCACRAGPYAGTPQYTLPESRATAARWLYEALAYDGRGFSDVRADELILNWNERRRITDTQDRLIRRELEFIGIDHVSRPEQQGIHHEVAVHARGGIVTFAFDSGPAASKAEAAFRRLATPLGPDEEAALIDPHRRLISNHVREYRNTGNSPTRRSDEDALADAIRRLEMITGRNYGRGLDAALRWHRHLGNDS